MENRIKSDFEKTFKDSLSKNELVAKGENLKSFLKDGFPSKRLENWKFSDLNQIINNNIGELNFNNCFIKNKSINNINLINKFDHNKIIFLNGKIENTNLKNITPKKLVVNIFKYASILKNDFKYPAK